MKKHLKILSLAVALVMILSSVPVALANSYPGLFPAGATAMNGEEREENSINIDVSGASNYTGAINVYAANGGTATHDVSGDLTSNLVTAQVISRESKDEFGDAEATLNVAGDVTAETRESGYPNKDAAVVALNMVAISDCEGDADANATVGGEVLSTDPYGKTRMERIDKWTTYYYEGIPVYGVQADADALDAGDASITVTAENSVTAEGKGEDDVTGVLADATSEGSGNAEATIEVKKDVSAKTDGGVATGVDANAESMDDGQAEADVTVGGDLTVTSSYSSTGADVTADAFGDASASVDVGGSIDVIGGSYAYGAYVEAYAEAENEGNATAALTVGGDVYATASGEYSSAYGVDIVAVGGEDTGDAVATAEVKGDIIASAAGESSDATGVEAHVSGENTAVMVDVTVGGDITATATVGQEEILLAAVSAETEGSEQAGEEENDGYIPESDANGILVTAMNGTVSIQVEGDISAEADEEAVGINIGDSVWSESAGAEGENALVAVSTEGVSAEAGESGTAIGVYMSAAHDGTVNVEIGEEGITAEAGESASGAEIVAYNGGTVTLSVDGDVDATDAFMTYGVEVWAFDKSEAVVDVEGAVTASAEGKDCEAIGIEATAKGKDASVDITAGSIEATGENAAGAVLMAGDSGTVSLTVNGDVSGETAGLALTCGDDTAEIDVVIDGTLTGGEAPIMLQGGETVIGENVSVAVWKIETEDEDAPLVVDYDVQAVDYNNQEEEENEEAGAPVYTPNEAAEKAVQYIIKVVDAWAAVLSFNNIQSSGEVTVGTGDDAVTYHTAVQDEDVKLSVTLEDTEVLEGVYYDEDTLVDELEQDENGNFLVRMLRGGGMLLGLKTHKHQLTSHPANAPTCVAGGNTAYWHCGGCNKYFSDAQCRNQIAQDSWVLPATGVHEPTAVAAKDPACMEEGNTAYWHCGDCGKYFSDAQCQNEIEKDSWIIPATGHDELTAFEAKEATQTEDGNTAYWYCPKCKKYFSDAEGRNEIAQNSWIIRATGTNVMTILKILDKNGKTEIAFRNNGTFKATFEDGSTQKGKFMLKDGKIVLVNDGDAQQTQMAITLNEESGKYDLQYQLSGNAENTFAFELEEADVNLLIRNRR